VIEKDKKPLYIKILGMYFRFCMIVKDKKPLYINNVSVYFRICGIEKTRNNYILII